MSPIRRGASPIGVTNPPDNRLRRTARKTGVGAAGLATIAVGVALIPLPGPGSLVVFGGLTMLGSEFPRARRLADHTKQAALGTIDRVRSRINHR